MPLRIVVPVDGSEPSEHAAAWAAGFARRTGAIVSICSAVDPMIACMAGAGGATLDPGPMLETLEDDAAAFCAAAAARFAAREIVATTTVLHGMPAEAIDAFALVAHADLMVLGTHARRGLARGVLGSVTAAVVGSSSVAVIALRSQTSLDDAGPIVVAIDDSEPSAAAARFALRIAQALRVPIRLVHVLAASENNTAATRSVLDELAHEAATTGVTCATEIRHGEIVAAVIATVAEYGASILATGTHGRGAIGRMFLGSVAEGLVRNAVVPVLIVRNAAEQMGWQTRE